MSEKSWLERATEAGPIHFREVCLQAVTAYSEEMVDIFNRGSSEDLVFFVTAMRLLERGLRQARCWAPGTDEMILTLTGMMNCRTEARTVTVPKDAAPQIKVTVPEDLQEQIEEWKRRREG
ncbi:MAG: hypothetical protein IKI35_05645 [Stomatobaculum sp.]|nr:hypothetical protein [Stomatobaculum sp.]MBR7058192.1 hypothetical protein [Stomatobaculum sp.]